VRPLQPDDAILRTRLNALYRDCFDQAMRRRRWNVAEDIPWTQVNRRMDPAIADVVESFCAVEMYLPDYIAKALPMIRANRGWAGFHLNWGYEESKHSLALRDWLLRSGLRSDEQMADLEAQIFASEWQPPLDSGVAMLIYGMVQELATALHYRNLRVCVQRCGDPALEQLLQFVAVDERAHHAFYRGVVQLFLELDRQGTLEQLRRVLLNFAMPATHLLAESQQRAAAIRSLAIFDEDVFTREVFHPILDILGVQTRELRRNPRKLL
jgi:acyl-[acyl-carrier-protein] desaturase